MKSTCNTYTLTKLNTPKKCFWYAHWLNNYQFSSLHLLTLKAISQIDKKKDCNKKQQDTHTLEIWILWYTLDVRSPENSFVSLRVCTVCPTNLILKWWIYTFHVFELWNEQINRSSQVKMQLMKRLAAFRSRKPFTFLKEATNRRIRDSVTVLRKSLS